MSHLICENRSLSFLLDTQGVKFKKKICQWPELGFNSRAGPQTLALLSLSLWALTLMDEHTTPGATSCSPQVSDLEFMTEVL